MKNKHLLSDTFEDIEKELNKLIKKHYYEYELKKSKITYQGELLAKWNFSIRHPEYLYSDKSKHYFSLWLNISNTNILQDREFITDENNYSIIEMRFSVTAKNTIMLKDYDPDIEKSVSISNFPEIKDAFEADKDFYMPKDNTAKIRNFFKLYAYFTLLYFAKNEILPQYYSGWSDFRLLIGDTFFGYTNISFNTGKNEYLKRFFNGEAEKIPKIYYDDGSGKIKRKKRMSFHSNDYINGNNEYNDEYDKKQAIFINSIKIFTNFFKANPVLILCFCYNLLAFSEPIVLGEYYQTEHDCWREAYYKGFKLHPFVLSITGKSSNKNINVCTVANLMCNMFSLGFKRRQSIDFKYAIAYNSTNRNKKSIAMFKHLPMLVSNGAYNVNLNHSNIKEILKIKNRLGFYPVLVSQNALNIFESININISDITAMPQNANEYDELKSAFNVFYTNYIDELSIYIEQAVSRRVGKIHCESINDWFFLEDPPFLRADDYKSINKAIDDETTDINKAPIAYDLYIALKIMYKICEKLHVLNAVQSFFNIAFCAITDYCKSSVLKNHNSVDIRKDFIHYLDAIFFENSHKPPYIHWEGRENKGKGEECFYLENNGLFEDFTKYSNAVLTKSEFNIFIKKSGYFVIKDDKTSLGKYRTYKSKRHYVLIVSKSALLSEPKEDISSISEFDSIKHTAVDTSDLSNTTVMHKIIDNKIHSGTDDTFKLQYFLDHEISGFDNDRKEKLRKEFSRIYDINDKIILYGYTEKGHSGKLNDSFTYKISADLPEFNKWKQDLPSKYEYYSNMLIHFIIKNKWHSVLDMCCGADFPLASYLNQKIGDKISITAADECDYSAACENITLLSKETFMKKYDFSAYDAVFAIEPKDKTEAIIKACTEQNKPFFIVLDNLPYTRVTGKTDAYPIDLYSYFERTYHCLISFGYDNKFYASSKKGFEDLALSRINFTDCPEKSAKDGITPDNYRERQKYLDVHDMTWLINNQS